MSTEVQTEKVLYPGVDVLVCDDAIKVRVVPLGVRHIRKFARDIAGALAAVASFQIRAGASKEETAKAIMGQMIPYAMDNLMALVAECVICPKGVTIDDLPHWDMPKIIEAWFVESFGEERKWRPWIEVVERAIEKVSGKKFSILETFSNSSPSAATPPKS